MCIRDRVQRVRCPIAACRATASLPAKLGVTPNATLRGCATTVRGVEYALPNFRRAEMRVHRWQRAVVSISATLVLAVCAPCLLYTSDAADERSSVDLG